MYTDPNTTIYTDIIELYYKTILHFRHFSLEELFEILTKVFSLGIDSMVISMSDFVRWILMYIRVPL